jgi:hypothetical protein
MMAEARETFAHPREAEMRIKVVERNNGEVLLLHHFYM